MKPCLPDYTLRLGESMDTTEPSEEDRGRFERLLMEHVRATSKMTIENLEPWHTRIRQCILKHKKDDSRLPLYEVRWCN